MSSCARGLHRYPLGNEAAARCRGPGKADFDFEAAPWVVAQLAAGEPTTALAGIHPGCFELFAYEPIRTVGDLRGKPFGIPAFGSSPHLLLAVMAAHVGLDPKKDIDWIVSPTGYSLEMFANREVDAFLGFPPEPQELRARGIGQRHPQHGHRPALVPVLLLHRVRQPRVRPVRTSSPPSAFCAPSSRLPTCASTEPQLVAQRLVDAGLTKRYEYALQSLTELPYASWREFDPEDTVRFFALRLHEVGMIKSTPQAIIADGTDWRFLNELKRELKA